MPFSESEWEQLKELSLEAFNKPPLLPEAQKVVELLSSIKPDELSEWLQQWVSPSAVGYILRLWEELSICLDDLKGLWPLLEEGSSQALRHYRRTWWAVGKKLGKVIREIELRMRPCLKVTLLGFGEISRVLDLEGSPLALWCDPETGKPVRMVFKKMLPFPSREAAEHHAHWYMEYNRLLRDKVGIEVPPFDVRIVGKGPGPVIAYMLQGRINPEQVCVGKFLEKLTLDSAAVLYSMILKEYGKVYRFNKEHAVEGLKLGIDGQIPNWAFREKVDDPGALTGHEDLIYLDTTVPMIRLNGQDVIDPEIYFLTLPAFARNLIKALNLHKKVLDRYYNFRTVMLDFVSNFIVRHRPDLVPTLIELSNEAISSIFREEKWSPITKEEVWKYYREDVFIWRLWRSLKLLRGEEARSLSLLTKLYTIWTRPIF